MLFLYLEIEIKNTNFHEFLFFFKKFQAQATSLHLTRRKVPVYLEIESYGLNHEIKRYYRIKSVYLLLSKSQVYRTGYNERLKCGFNAIIVQSLSHLQILLVRVKTTLQAPITATLAQLSSDQRQMYTFRHWTNDKKLQNWGLKEINTSNWIKFAKTIKNWKRFHSKHANIIKTLSVFKKKRYLFPSFTCYSMMVPLDSMVVVPIWCHLVAVETLLLPLCVFAAMIHFHLFSTIWKRK